MRSVLQIDLRSALFEQLGQRLRAFLREHTAHNLDAMRQPWILDHVVKRARRTGPRVPCAEHETVDPVGDDGARAHRTRFDRDEELAALEPPVAETLGPQPERVHLGMGCRIASQFPAVVRFGDHIVAPDEHRTDRHVTVLQRNERFLKRQRDERCVAIHGR